MPFHVSPKLPSFFASSGLKRVDLYWEIASCIRATFSSSLDPEPVLSNVGLFRNSPSLRANTSDLASFSVFLYGCGAVPTDVATADEILPETGKVLFRSPPLADRAEAGKLL